MLRRTTLQIPIIAALAMASLTATAPAQAEPEVLHVPGEVHFAMTAHGAEVLHTVRRGDGNWYPFNFVPNAPVGHSPHTVASAIVGSEEHVMTYYSHGIGPQTSTWYVIRRASGSWATQVSPPGGGTTATFALAGVAGELHRVGWDRTGDGSLQHALRRSDGTWSSLSTVPVQSTYGDEFAIAGSGGALHVLVNNIPLGGAFSSFVRYADGGWERLPDVPFTPPTGTRAVTVVMTQVGTELHAVVTGGDGRLYHAARRSNGAWTAFHDVASQTGDPGSVVRQATITAASGALHLAIATDDQRLLHTIRFGDGSWLPYGDVEQATGWQGDPGRISIAGS
ncbi:hypothetical protein AB0K14_26860 [Actinosynnema sp. NPDC050801]|uniref:hypothetical protein n=1 Tax=unclassified Actinosynnema TaxID=2637065 RepID=UPI0033DA5488